MNSSMQSTTWISNDLGSIANSPSNSSTTASSPNADQWHAINAARRQQTHAERAKQLQDLEQQITDATNWSRLRAELVTPPRRRLARQESWKQAAMKDDSVTLQLHNTSLEELEALIAASAQRLATYRQQKSLQSLNRSNSSSPLLSGHDDSGYSDTKAVAEASTLEEDVSLSGSTSTKANASQTDTPTKLRNYDCKLTAATYDRLRNMAEASASNKPAAPKRNVIQQFDPLVSTSSASSTSPAGTIKVRPRRRPKDIRADKPLPFDGKTSLPITPRFPRRLPTPRDPTQASTRTNPQMERCLNSRFQLSSPMDKVSSESGNDVESNMAKDRQSLFKEATGSQPQNLTTLPSASLSHTNSHKARQDNVQPDTADSKLSGDGQTDTPAKGLRSYRDMDVSQFPSRPVRTRTVSMMSALPTKSSSRTIRKDLADFDPLLTRSGLNDSSEDLGSSSDTLSTANHIKKQYQPPKARMNDTASDGHESGVDTLTTPWNVTRSSNVKPTSKIAGDGTTADGLQRSRSTSSHLTSGRKTAKTLSANLGSPSSGVSLALPPMKLEPLNLTVPPEEKEDISRTVVQTPTRIPKPTKISRPTYHENSAGSEDELLEHSGSDRNSHSRDRNDTSVNSGANTSARCQRIESSAPWLTQSDSVRTGLFVPYKTRTGPLGRQRTISMVNPSTKGTTSSSGRRQSLVNDLLQGQLDKEKQNAKHLAVNPVSVHGLITLPESLKGNRLERQASLEKTGTNTLPRQIPAVRRRLNRPIEDKRHKPLGEGGVIHIPGPFQKYIKAAPSTSADSGQEQPNTPKENDNGMRAAMSPQAALKLHHASLTSFEKTEILEYPSVYFVGNQAQKRQATVEQTTCNHGYDDDRGDYQIVMRDHLAYRYEVLEVMGKGSFGQVLKCFDHKTGQMVAVKIIRNKKRFHKQALVEVKILQDLIRWDPEDKHSIVRMMDSFYFRSHLCIVFECLSINLYDFIKSNEFQGFSMGLIRRFTMQLLNSLVLLRKHKLIHCDLKPENVLLRHPTKSSIKVIDFGSSCLESEKVYTYIQSRFYRSPEVILGMDYSMAIDMWSVGCILAELHTGYPLFPGESEQDQLACIMEVQGIPDKRLVEKCSRRKLFFDSNGHPRIAPNSKGRKRRPNSRTLAYALKTTDENFVDFVNQCLQWDPELRLKPEDAFKHAWILHTSSSSKPQQR